MMANYIALLIPLFLLLIAIEWWYSNQRKDNRYSGPNTALNMAVGAFDQIGALFYMFLLYVAMEFSKQHFQIFQMALDWKQWVLSFIVVDFVSYWYHRFSHRINFLWAGHVTHHSSSFYNLSNGFRTSPFQGLFRIPFWMLMPVIGFEPWLLVITFKIAGLHDFFVHTSYIGKLGWLEKVLITPSHHRVHHGKNDIYIDKNYGSVLLLWDKIFGTFQAESESVQFGITADYVDNNPIHAITYHFQGLWLQVRNTRGIRNKLLVLIMPPGWGIKQGSDDLKGNIRSGDFRILESHRLYAFWLLVTGVTGFILILFAHQMLSIILVGYAFVFTSTSITQGSIILNKGIHSEFRFWEKFRMFVFLLFGYFLLDAHQYLGHCFLCVVMLTAVFFIKWAHPKEMLHSLKLREIAKNH